MKNKIEYEVIVRTPILVLYRNTETSDTDECPFCGSTHAHGTLDGHRVSHCASNGKETIVAEDGTTLNQSNGYIIRTRIMITDKTDVDKKGYLQHTGNYESKLKNGWGFRIDFCQVDRIGKWNDGKEYYINEEDLIEMHKAIKGIMDEIRILVTGDIIDFEGLYTVTAVHFDYAEKEIFLWLN